MKQCIDKSQWDELSEEFQRKLQHNQDWHFEDDVTIGEMISFLGEDIRELKLLDLKDYGSESCWEVWAKDGCVDGHLELCDALWSACKHKLL